MLYKQSYRVPHRLCLNTCKQYYRYSKLLFSYYADCSPFFSHPSPPVFLSVSSVSFYSPPPPPPPLHFHFLIVIKKIHSHLSEIAEVCAFLASSRSSYMTGAAVEVTGMNFSTLSKCEGRCVLGLIQVLVYFI